MTTSALPTRISGWTAPGFDAVREAFESNLRVGEDLGAALSVYRHGRCLVDLWGGYQIDGMPYRRDSLQLVFSTSKGVLALCLAALVENGSVDPAAPVASYWPEFAARGKGSITVEQLASHRAGLPGFPAGTSLADLCSWDRAVALLADLPPLWPPAAPQAYHALTFGHLVGEVLRRVTGLTPGALLRALYPTHVLDEAFLGLPPEYDGRVARMVEATATTGLNDVMAQALDDAGSATYAAFGRPAIDVATFDVPPAWRAEIPAVGLLSTARGLARLYAAAVDGPLRALGPAIVDDVRRPRTGGSDVVAVDQPLRFGLGFLLSCPRQPMFGRGSFGHDGRGGSLAFAHPESGISYGFVCNRSVTDPGPDRRNVRLLAALAECL